MDDRDEEMYEGIYMDDEQDSPVVYSKAEKLKLTTFIIIVAVLSFILIFFCGLERHGIQIIQETKTNTEQAVEHDTTSDIVSQTVWEKE